MSGNNYTEKEIYQMLFSHEITKEKALSLLSAAPQRIAAEAALKESHVHILEEAGGKAHQAEDILDEIIKIVAGNLHMSEDELAYEMSFKDLGVDSINGIEIIRDVNRFYGLNLDAVVIYDHANVTKLSELVLKELNKNHITLTQTGVNTPDKESAREEYTDDIDSAEPGIEEEEVYLILSDIISSNLHLPKEELRYEVSFKELGVDSINGIEIIRDVNKSFGLNLDAVIIYDYSTISKLADYVVQEKNRTARTLKAINPEYKQPDGFQTGNKISIRDTKNNTEDEKISLASTDRNYSKANNLRNAEGKLNDIIGDSISRDSTIRDSIKQGDYKREDIKLEDIRKEDIKQVDIKQEQDIIYKQEIIKPDKIKLSDIKQGNILPASIGHGNNHEFDVQGNTKFENNNAEVQKPAPIQLISTDHIQNAISTGNKSMVMNTADKSLTDINNTWNTTDINFTSENSTGINPASINSKYSNVADNFSIKQEKGSVDVPGLRLTGKEENGNWLHHYKEEDIAVIGISGRFPGAGNVDEFWSNLEQEKDSIITIPKERWNWEEYYDPDPKAPGKSYSKVGGFIKGIDRFDPLFFNISPVEAVYMDPQQRFFLEEVWKALEDAGCSDRSLSDKKCGVFVGASQGDYVKALTRNNAENSGEAFTGMAVSILASRISYFLNLIGPCITVDTACSSSLSALHLACQSIRNRESDMAIVGGVRLMVTPDLHIATSKVEMLSKAGKCRAFDNSADGTILSEGVGAIILKPLKIALEEGHSIYGVIKSSGINQDGKTNGITAPSMQSQIRLETEVYERADINPREISYIETHGTGTKLGDPIEVKALTSVFEKYTSEKQFCIIGSVKSNIGHTTTAAGVTSIIKVLLAMKHKKIPATLHFQEPNTHLSLKETPFYVNHKTVDWRVPKDNPRLAAVSAFGFSGTNAHVVLQEFKGKNEEEVTQEYPYYLITLSAKTRESYDRKIVDLLSWLEKPENNSNIGDIAYTLQVGRSHFNIRGAFVVDSCSELKDRLKELVVTGQTADYFMEANNSKPVKADANTKVLIHKIFEKLKDSVSAEYKEYKEYLTELARLYVQNKVTGCESIYTGHKFQLIHLPTYPFFGDRYWVEEDTELYAEKSTTAFLHPMIDRKLSETEEAAYEKSFQGTEFFLKDHIVQNEKVLPAVAYLEIARAAGSIFRNRKVMKITNNYWLNALKVKDSSQNIKLILLPVKTDSNVMEYEVISQEQNEQEILHGRGQIEYAALSQEGVKEYLDLDTIRSRCPSLITGLECYQLFIKGGLKLGKSFQSIQKLYFNENEVLASIQLPEHLKENFHEYLLHPTIMDGALEAVIGMVSAKARNGGVTLPYYIGEVEILGELTENCFSYARYTGRKKNGLQESDSYEVFILDEEGKVLVKVKDFSLWTIGAKANEIQAAADKVHYYKYIWEKSDLCLPENHPEALGKDLLIFDTDSSLSDYLRKKSEGKYNIILVKPGADYVEAGNEFTIAPAHKEDYVRFIQSLKEKEHFPGNIVYLWSKEPDYEFESILIQDAEYTIYPLLYLYQALENLVSDKRIKLNYMFQGDGKVFSPFSAAFGGFAKSLRLENAKYSSKSIQFNAAFSLEEVSNLILLELLAAAKEDVEILHTTEGRFVRTIQEYFIEDNSIQRDNSIQKVNSSQRENTESNVSDKDNFKTKGIYLISGGFGKLGLILARFLAEAYQAKLCLTSRSPLDAEKVTVIKELEALGSEVFFVQGDVSVLNDTAAIIEAVKERFGRINGIIHCAGMTRDAYLRDKGKDDMEQVIIPKVQGTINLDLLTKDEPLDFIILFSSTAAVTGNLGQADYAYGNCFMDFFSQLRNGLGKQGLRYGNTLSVNWPLWKEGGLQVGKATEDLFASMGITTLETTNGIQSLKDTLRAGEDQLVVFQGNAQKLRKLLGIKDTAANANYKPIYGQNHTHKNAQENAQSYAQSYAQSFDQNHDQNHAQSNTQSNIPANTLNTFHKTGILEDIHRDVKNAVKEILRIKEKDIFLEKDMNEYGFHSLTFTELANKINKLYSIQINPSIFFEYGTLGALSDYLYKEHYDSISAVHGKEEAEQMTPANLVSAASVEEDFPNTLPGKREPIAIIGMGGIMPQSEDMLSFWRNLEEARDLVTEIPSDRWKKEDLPDNISKWGGFMNEIDKFDPLFFGISPMEAELMDPQQRIFMQTVWETIEDAGYKPSDLAGSNTGLFVGVSTTDYRDVLKDSEIEALTSTGNSHCILTNRISFLLNLHGPSEPIDTACSSSLVAIHRGVESIYCGDCDMAIAGGVNVIASPTLHISFSKAGMLSPDGRCKTFDEKANGYVRGEGTGAILLKPLSKALKDGDNIYALIKGTAINHGGRAASLTAPNTKAQAEVIMKAFDKAGFEPETVSYIEAHGTGTQLGDPVEVNGLIKAFKEAGKKDLTAPGKQAYCGIGSVKTNIGHLETAAGIASVLKVLLAFQYKTIPGMANFSVQNPYIQLADSPFYIVEKTKEWKALTDNHGTELPRRAGVSSFGFGGVNAHIALEAYEGMVREKDRTDSPHIFILSARNKERLSAYARKMLSFLGRETENNYEAFNNRSLTDFAYTLQAGREEMGERLAIVFSDWQELIHKLTDYLQEKDEIDGVYHNPSEKGKGKAGVNERDSDTATINELIQKGEFMKLASLWVSGAKIDWKLLYGGKHLKRIPLPTYPFEKRRVWKAADKITSAQNVRVKEKSSHISASFNGAIPEDSTASIEDCFYLPTWKPVPLPDKKESSGNSPEDRKVLILVPINYAEMSRQLIEYYCKAEVYVILLGTENRRIGRNSWEINVSDEKGIGDCLARIDSLEQVYFLGGITSQDTAFKNPESLEITQEMGVISLFRLIKAFVEKELDNQKLHIKIITNNVHAIDDEDVIPCAGSILGFAKSMAKEYQYWKTTCIDIDLKDWENDKEILTRLIAEEPAGKNGEEVVIRNRQRYLHRIIPTGLSISKSTSFRKDGVYLILGGAGGIGLEFCRYLTLKIGAKVALVGRSELDPDKFEKISSMKASGAKILYVKADATDLNSMKAAVLEIKLEFGRINGVVHSAIVMKDRAIRNMSERDLIDSLEPKVRGSIFLYEAVKEEKLDFFMFFSSIQSFVGNGGQANYAAACGFKDSFAFYLRKSVNLPVKLINWGYWGSVGVASSEEHNRIMASKGMLSIQPEEGMEAIERILSDKASQVVVLKAKPFLLKHTDIIDSTNPGAVSEHEAEQVPSLLFVNKGAEKELQAIAGTQLGVSCNGDSERGLSNNDLLNHLKSCIIQCIAEVLKVEAGEVDNSTSFSDYGVDSITGMELIERINTEFKLTLKTTILFDYSNVDDLAGYIETELGHETEKQIDTFDNRRVSEADPLELLAKGVLNVEEVMEMISGMGAENPA